MKVLQDQAERDEMAAWTQEQEVKWVYRWRAGLVFAISERQEAALTLPLQS